MKLSKSTLGFTLVELLIVMALLSAIALTVIAAINPIEQANRAKDSRYKADGGQLISAIDRYFTSRSEFPWVTSGTAPTNTEAFGFVDASVQDVGICALDDNCSTDPVTDGYLVADLELKSEFKNRDFIQKDTADALIKVGKAEGASESVYACWIPAAKSNQKNAATAVKVYTLAADGTRTLAGVDAAAINDACGTDWVTSACYVCIPE